MKPDAARPLVSIVIPTLNRAPTLRRAIDSVLTQDYPHIECLVMDGGSNDGSVGILQGYGSRIQWESQPDGGHSQAINKGWLRSRGEILAWLNADDIYEPRAVEAAVNHFLSRPECVVVYGDCLDVDADNRVVRRLRPGPWQLERALRLCDHVIHQAASFIRRWALEKAGWVDPEFVSKKDHELWLRLSMLGALDYIPVTLARACSAGGYLDHRGDMTAQACVLLTRKFFQRGDLAPRIARMRHRSLSNAYLRGVEYLWVNGRFRHLSVRYLLRAFLADPLNDRVARLFLWLLRGWADGHPRRPRPLLGPRPQTNSFIPTLP